MAHCPPELLDDLGDVLAEVRGWAGVKEDTPGVFYVRREPFLHFHLLKGGRRRGDIKGSRGWVSLGPPATDLGHPPADAPPRAARTLS